MMTRNFGRANCPLLFGAYYLLWYVGAGTWFRSLHLGWLLVEIESIIFLTDLCTLKSRLERKPLEKKIPRSSPPDPRRLDCNSPWVVSTVT